MGEYDQLLAEAERKGWATPRGDARRIFGDGAWIRYWRAKQHAEKNPDRGRPVPPHRPGRSAGGQYGE